MPLRSSARGAFPRTSPAGEPVGLAGEAPPECLPDPFDTACFPREAELWAVPERANPNETITAPAASTSTHTANARMRLRLRLCLASARARRERPL